MLMFEWGMKKKTTKMNKEDEVKKGQRIEKFEFWIYSKKNTTKKKHFLHTKRL